MNKKRLNQGFSFLCMVAMLVFYAFGASGCGSGSSSAQAASNGSGSNGTNHGPGPTPTVTVTLTPGPGPTPTVTVTVTPGPTPTITSTFVPVPGPTPTVTITVRPIPIPEPTIVPLPLPIVPIHYPTLPVMGAATQSLQASAVSCSSVEQCAESTGAVASVGAAFVGLENQTEGSVSDSVGGGTKDVDLQSAQANEADQEARAQGVANSFGMDYSKALALTRLADQVQSLSKTNQMTSEDQDAITQQALAVAGISASEVNATVTAVVQTGDQAAIDHLMTKAATNLGMPSSAGLRDQILPALGIRF